MMQQGSIEVTTTIPQKFIPKDVTSSGQAVVRSSIVEYPSFETTVYCADAPNNGSSNTFVTSIASNGLLALNEGYFRLPLSVWMSADDSGNALAAFTNESNIAAGARTWTDLGGVHALIKSIEVRAVASGTILQYVDNYNLIVAQNIAAGTFVPEKEKMQRDWDELILGQFAPEFEQGITNSVTATYKSKLYEKCQARDAQKRLWLDGAANPTSAALATVSRDLCFRPEMSFFKLEAFPLHLLPGGVKVTITLANSYEALVRQVGGVMTVGLGVALSAIHPFYKFTNMRYVGKVIEVDGSIMKDYESAFSSPTGLLYQIPTWRVVSREADARSSGTNSVSFDIGQRSVRRGFGVIQQIALISGVWNYTNRSLSHGLLSKIQYYYFSVGAQQFPQNQQRVYPQNLVIASEAGQYPQELVRAISNILSLDGLGVGPWEFTPSIALAGCGRRGYMVDATNDKQLNTRYGYGSGGNVVNYQLNTISETACCMFPVEFRREDSFLCGVDLSMLNVSWFFNRPTAAVDGELPANDVRANPLRYHFIYEYDCLLQLQDSQISILS